MARKRMIDPSIWQNEDFSNMHYFSRLVFIGLFSNADDYGKGRAKTAYLKSTIFPYDENLKPEEVDSALNEIAAKMNVTFYETDGKEYYSLDGWDKWQRVDRPSDSLIPSFDEANTTIRRTFDEHSTKPRRSIPPSIDKININKKNNTPRGVKHTYGTYENVLLTDADIEKLKEKYPDWKDKIESLSQGIELKGYKYKNHYLAILKWDETQKKNDKPMLPDLETMYRG